MRSSLRLFAALPGLLCLLIQLPTLVVLFLSRVDAAPSSRRLKVEEPPPPRLKHRRVDTEDFYSMTHCVGENFGDDAWKYKSCQFRNLCFDTEAKEYVLFPSHEELDLQRLLDARPDGLVVSSTLMEHTSVSLGTLTPSWSVAQQSSLRWFPRIETNRSRLAVRGVDMLPDDAVLVPFHSFRATHAGHLLWDDGYPLFLLMSTFGLEEKQPLLVRQVLEEPLPGTCDVSDDSRKFCHAQFDKYLPLLGVPSSDWFWTSDSIPEGSAESPFICARLAAAGLGLVANHLHKASGWTGDDYKTTHTVGHGALLWQFRRFMARHLLDDGIALPSRVNATTSLEIVFACSSSSMALTQAYDTIRQELASRSSAQVRLLRLEEIDLKDQISIVARTAVLIVDCGGDSLAVVPFLPRLASAIMYCSDSDAVGKPVQWALEWDIISHAGYFQTHWLTTKDGVVKLVSLIQTEINVIQALSSD